MSTQGRPSAGPAGPGWLGRLAPPAIALAGALAAGLDLAGWGGKAVRDAVPVALSAFLAALALRQVRLRRSLSSVGAGLDDEVEARAAGVASKERWYRALVQHGSDVVTVLDPSGIVVWQSGPSASLLGEALVGSSLLEVVDPRDRPRAARLLERCVASGGQLLTGSFRLRGPDGRVVHVEAAARSLLSNPDVAGVVLTTRDVSERVELEARLASLAFHDPLTGLPNRQLFVDRLEHALAGRARDGRLVAVLRCDLDGFRAVNEALGSAGGDEALRTIAGRFGNGLRPSDTVARLGGDEFAVLVSPLATAEEAEQVAARLLQTLAAPIVVEGRTSYVGASIGIAATDVGEESAETLLANAELALFRAKSRGGRRWHRHEPARLGRLDHRVELEVGLGAALERRQLVVHYQPLVELATGVTRGVEALVRWDREGRLVPPAEFVPLAEETGLIVPLGAYVLEEACRQAAAWQAKGPLTVSVNLSARQLVPDLSDLVRAALASSGLPPSRLVLELTERSLLDRPEGALEVVAALQGLGVTIAVDDFGTGSSSLAHLSRLPVDVLKVDRSFVTRLDTEEGAGVVAAIVDLARTLGLHLTAEGIEATCQLEALRSLGVVVGQGYLLSRPGPPEVVATTLIASQEVPPAGQARGGRGR